MVPASKATFNIDNQPRGKKGRKDGSRIITEPTSSFRRGVHREEGSVHLTH